MKLWRKSFRDIKQSVGQFIAFVLIVAVGAFFYAGLVTYSNTLSAYTEDYFLDHNLSDLSVAYEHISEDEITRLGGIEGVAMMEGRYSFDASQVFEDHKATLSVHSIPANNAINTPAMIEGRIPTRADELLLDSRYAAEHHIRVGDAIGIRANEKLLTFTVSGLAENAEHAKKNDVQDHRALGVAYIAEAAIPAIAGGSVYNEVMVDAAEGYDIDEIGRSIEQRSSEEQLAYVGQISKERSFGYSEIKETIHNNRLMSRVIPLVLFVIEAIILFLAMSRMIDAERKQIGIMKALGVKDRTIMLHYMGYPVWASVIGSLLGCVLADLVFIPFVTESNARAYSLPGITFSLSYDSAIPPILFSGAFGMLACYLSGRAILSENAAQAMRPKPPKTRRRLAIERVPGIWRRIPYSYKLILRNLLLNKRKAFASAVGVVVSTVLLITAFGTQTALMQVAGQIEEVYRYDLRVDYAAGTTPDRTERPAGAIRQYDLAAYAVAFVTAAETEDAALVATAKENELIRFYDDNGNRLRLEDGGVIVPQSYADKYGISEGDTVSLKFTAPEHQSRTAAMKVLRVSAQYNNPSFYCTPAYLESFGISYRPTSRLIEAGGAEELVQVRSFYEQADGVDAITDKDDLKASAQYIVKQNNFVFVMFIVCAVILAFGAIYTISSINIYERVRELATLKVLGYPKAKINRLIFLENVMLTTAAVAAALPVGGYLFEMIIQALSSSHQQIPDRIDATAIAASVMLAYLLTLAANLLLRGKVMRINMIESLKSME